MILHDDSISYFVLHVNALAFAIFLPIYWTSGLPFLCHFIFIHYFYIFHYITHFVLYNILNDIKYERVFKE